MENAAIIKEIIVQILGFGVVFLILKKFAWGSLLSTMDERRRKIEHDFQSIDQQKQSLSELEKEYKKKLEQIDQEARQKIQEAAQTGQLLARDIHEKARVDAEQMIEKAKAEINQEIAKARIALRDEAVQMSAMITEKVIKSKMDSSEHKRLAEQFVKELESVKN